MNLPLSPLPDPSFNSIREGIQSLTLSKQYIHRPYGIQECNPEHDELNKYYAQFDDTWCLLNQNTQKKPRKLSSFSTKYLQWRKKRWNTWLCSTNWEMWSLPLWAIEDASRADPSLWVLDGMGKRQYGCLLRRDTLFPNHPWHNASRPSWGTTLIE